MSDKLPTPVHIVAPTSMPVTAAEPLPVVIKDPEGKAAPIPASSGMTLPPTTTLAEDKVSEGQRHINRVWEYTQASIAIMVVATFAGIMIHKTVTGSDKSMPSEVTAVVFLVIGSYFQRTNHTLTGGVGAKLEQRYTGR